MHFQQQKTISNVIKIKLIALNLNRKAAESADAQSFVHMYQIYY